MSMLNSISMTAKAWARTCPQIGTILGKYWCKVFNKAVLIHPLYQLLCILTSKWVLHSNQLPKMY